MSVITKRLHETENRSDVNLRSRTSIYADKLPPGKIGPDVKHENDHKVSTAFILQSPSPKAHALNSQKAICARSF